MRRRSFTLIELLIFTAIFAVVMIGIVTVLVVITRVQSDQSSKIDVTTQGQFLIQQIQYDVRAARLVDMADSAATGTLQLRETAASSSIDPVTVYASGSVAYVQQGAGGTPTALTTGKVNVSALSFTRHYQLASSSAYGTDSVNYSFTMSENTSNTTKQYTQTFQSSAAVSAPVPKIALVQQASGANNNAGVTSVNASYASANATGSLLVAVVSNVGTAAATVSLGDTAGDTWTMIASTSYAAYNQKTVIFDAPNVKNGANTVTITFGSSVNYPTLFLYEYRNAATASSFDASSTQNVANSGSPSSGSANATSGVELLLGTLYSNPSTQVPAPGSGFTLETSSTVSATYVEDENTYVTGPVSANWSYSSLTPSSSVVLVTFK